MTSANDMKAARETYEGFLSLIKVAVPVIALIVAFVILIIQ
jgi:tRNA threonylcarbamoyladenosine modification (KEOPS) complex  Pcc1 subunit